MREVPSGTVTVEAMLCQAPAPLPAIHQKPGWPDSGTSLGLTVCVGHAASGIRAALSNTVFSVEPVQTIILIKSPSDAHACVNQHPTSSLLYA